MTRALLSAFLTTLPVMALAVPGEITPMARYCAEALVDSRPLMTSAMVATSAEAVSRGGADERTEFFTVPNEDLVFSRLKVSDLSACSVFPVADHPGWSVGSVTGYLEDLNLLPAPECGQPGQSVWLSRGLNLKRNGVTVLVGLDGDAVREILAYETPKLTRPSDCKPEAEQ